MKLLIVLALVALASAQMRTILFNETYIVKMPVGDVEMLQTDPNVPGFMDITDFPNLKGAAAKLACEYLPAPQEAILGHIVEPIFASISQSNIEQFDVHLANYFNRYYTTTNGRDSALWIRDTASQFASSAGRSDVVVETFTHSWTQPSIIARIPGTNPQYSVNRVVIGAHEDSTAGGASVRAPGACDNGSGSAVLLEIFRLAMENDFKPERTVEFHWYAAEEVGLLGSQAIAQDYASKGICVEAMYNYDMVAYWANNGRRVRVITDSAYTDSAFNQFVRVLIDKYATIPYYNQGYGRAASDHASWARANYRACHAKESGSYGPIHTPNDLPSNLDFAYATEFVRLGLGWVYEMGFVPTSQFARH